MESAEHVAIGNSINLSFGANRTEPAAGRKLKLGGASLDYGHILALAGDFYGLPKEPISDVYGDPADDRFRRAFDTLANGDPNELSAIVAILRQEIDRVNTAISQGQKASTAYAAMGDSLSQQWNVATGGGTRLGWLPFGRYLKLAMVNWDHFGNHAGFAYQAGHRVALKQAVAAKGTGNPADLELAYAMNAFADHFMTDMFSAGHMRTPRKQLHDGLISSSIGDWLSRAQHDEDCKYGLHVANKNGDEWRAYGDKKYFDQENEASRAMITRAVQISADEIFQAFESGSVPPEYAYGALKLTPNMEKVAGYHGDRLEQDPNKKNHSALFVWNIYDDPRKQWLETRVPTNDRASYKWTSTWTGVTTAAEIKVAGLVESAYPGLEAVAAFWQGGGMG